ncbi:WYL domain-containing protein [Morganella morganii]|uniref:WYL domain-containing protein n=1 Tax=Morganella morganii TaxID=582 RepID=UPI0013A798C6|nr:WYL domain-containing protein [Morganella morganii]QIC11917.1 WYL domain-containing protein [Morganella morganii]
MSLQLLEKAILERKSISFEYNKTGKTLGVRIGNPHAIFIFKAKDGRESTKVHLVQVDGVTDSEPNFPDFRMFNIEEITNVAIIDSDIPFDIDSKYNPVWAGYDNVIAKV